jgi:hypothetical protein
MALHDLVRFLLSVFLPSFFGLCKLLKMPDGISVVPKMIAPVGHLTTRLTWTLVCKIAVDKLLLLLVELLVDSTFIHMSLLSVSELYHL